MLIYYTLALSLKTSNAQKKQISVFYDAVSQAYSYKAGIVEGAAATGVFDPTQQKSGWGQLSVQAVRKTPSFPGEKLQRSAFFAAGMAEGLLTCDFVAAVSKNNDDPEQTKNAALLNYTLHTMEWARQNAKSNKTEYWTVTGQLLAQFDGIVHGYNQSSCSQENPLTATQLFLMNMDGDLEDLKNKFQAGPSSAVTGSPRDAWRPQHCSSLVKILKNKSDIIFGHSTWDTYSNAAPRIFKTYTLPVERGGQTFSNTVHFSSTGPWLSSVDDFYTVTGTAELGVMETSNTVIDTRLYAKVQPESMLSWMRAVIANRLAKDGADWARIFGMYHSGTYTNQWQVVDLSRFEPGQARQGAGLLTILEEVPGLVHSQDMTGYLNKHSYWPSYNVPYFEDIRAANGDTNGSWTTAPRAELFKKFQGKVTSIATFQHLLRWNDYQSEPIISGGDPCNAIACRADLRSAGSRPMAAFGAIDAKMSSFQTLFGGASSINNTLTVWAQAGPTHDEQAVFCWNTTNFPDPHHMHPNCFDHGWEQLAPPF